VSLEGRAAQETAAARFPNRGYVWALARIVLCGATGVYSLQHNRNQLMVNQRCSQRFTFDPLLMVGVILCVYMN
jgi:hypothetical protein